MDFSSKYATFTDQLNEIRAKLVGIDTHTILLPDQMEEIKSLKLDANLLLWQTRVLMNELRGSRCLTDLMAFEWVAQPFPGIFRQDARFKLDASKLVLKLVTAGSIIIVNQTRATIQMFRYHDLVSNCESPTQGVIQNLDADNCVSFPLRFIAGTAKRVSQLMGLAMVEARMFDDLFTQKINIQSPLSDYFMTIVHPSQFVDASGRLFNHAFFESELSIPAWSTLANFLQLYFLQLTNQPIENYHRGLARSDLQYIHERFFANHPCCTTMQFQVFWRWFGPILKTLRYTRHINDMWQTGIILGFFQRPEIDEILTSKTGGTFVLRFSETVRITLILFSVILFFLLIYVFLTYTIACWVVCGFLCR